MTKRNKTLSLVSNTQRMECAGSHSTSNVYRKSRTPGMTSIQEALTEALEHPIAEPRSRPRAKPSGRKSKTASTSSLLWGLGGTIVSALLAIGVYGFIKRRT